MLPTKSLQYQPTAANGRQYIFHPSNLRPLAVRWLASAAPLRPASHPAMRSVAHAACSRCGSPNPPSVSTLDARSGRADCIGRPCASSARRPPAGEYVSVESLGRSSVAGVGSLFPPCLRPFPPCGAQSPALFPRTRRPPSSVRANAQPTGVRASVGRARPATLTHLRGLPSSWRFPSLAGLATLAPTQTPALSLVGFATLRPRHASPRAGNMKRLLGAWCYRSPRGQTMRNVRSYHFMPCGICASRDDRTRAYYAEKRTHVRPLLFSGDYSVTICEVCPR